MLSRSCVRIGSLASSSSSRISGKRLELPGRRWLSSNGNMTPAAEGNNPLQARAKQMHNEIESIVKKHDQRHKEDAEKVGRLSGLTGKWKHVMLKLFILF